MNHKNSNVYCGRFRKLKLDAFGLEQTLDVTVDIEVYQSCANPERWETTPTLSRHGHAWLGRTAEDAMAAVAADFETCICPFELKTFRMPAPRVNVRRRR